ncbi:hypothetical protein [Paraburkholderia sp. J7]|uniref:hypothetical protein n=1 Tax=Paraburkholderia sp. J7 TaxID=2805438 RepID=UPI002AB6412B|nr:hypothetical protein [Paraburkholderia sp. J7]
MTFSRFRYIGGGSSMPEAVEVCFHAPTGREPLEEGGALPEDFAAINLNACTKSKRETLSTPTFGVDTRVIDMATGVPFGVNQQGTIDATRAFGAARSGSKRRINGATKRRKSLDHGDRFPAVVTGRVVRWHFQFNVG